MKGVLRFVLVVACHGLIAAPGGTAMPADLSGEESPSGQAGALPRRQLRQLSVACNEDSATVGPDCTLKTYVNILGTTFNSSNRIIATLRDDTYTLGTTWAYNIIQSLPVFGSGTYSQLTKSGSLGSSGNSENQTSTFTNIVGAQLNDDGGTLLGAAASTANYLTNVQGNVTFQSNNLLGAQVGNQSYYIPINVGPVSLNANGDYGK